MDRDKLKEILLFLILIMLFIDIFSLAINYNTLVKPYPEFWQNSWLILVLIFIAIFLYRNRHTQHRENVPLANVIEGAVGGFIVAFISLFSSEFKQEYGIIIGFLYLWILWILYAYYARPFIGQKYG